MIQEKAFTTIADKIMTASAMFHARKSAPIKGVDIHLDQYNHPQEFELFQTPYVFLEISTAMENNRRSASGTLTIVSHLVIDPKILTAYRADNPYPNLRIYAYQSILHSLIRSCNAKEFAPPKLSAQDAIISNGVFYILRDTYTAPFNEYNESVASTTTDGEHDIGILPISPK